MITLLIYEKIKISNPLHMWDIPGNISYCKIFHLDVAITQNTYAAIGYNNSLAGPEGQIDIYCWH